MSTDAKISRLITTFGHGLERDVLEAVLAMHEGDVQATINFLQADQGGYVDPYAGGAGAANQEKLPDNYMSFPKGYSLAQVQKHQAVLTRAQTLKNFFLQEGNSFADHMREQTTNGPHYIATLLLLLQAKVAISSINKSRCLAAAWARKDRELANYLLSFDDVFQFPEVLRALKTLDGPRKIRAIQKKIARMQAQGTAKTRTLGRIRNRLNDATQESSADQQTSVSGALCRRISQWLETIPVSKLEFFALQMPKEPWQELADIVHPSPANFQIDWFLKFCYGTEAPPSTMVADCMDLNEDNVHELIARYDIPYSFLRTRLNNRIPPEVCARVVQYEPLDAIVWYYEELGGTAEVDRIISQRLDEGAEPNFSYGKFMERLLFFRQRGAPFFHKLIPIAEKRLAQINLPLEPPVAVLGDASYSMDVAIRTSTIIASLLAALCAADLRFFNVHSFPPEKVPRTVEDVLEVATQTKADGLTAPGCTIDEYLRTRKVIKSFIVVTDEIENEPYHSEFFAQSFYRYYTTVYPARLVFVSFLDNPKEKGRMVRALENLGIVPLQFRLDSRRPDLTKVDTLLGLLSAESEFFSQHADQIAAQYEQGGFQAAISELKKPTVELPTTGTVASANTVQEIADLDGADVPIGRGKQDRDALVVSDDGSCVICMDALPDTALIECGHLVCGGCAPGLTICPICRAPVLRTLRVFKP